MSRWARRVDTTHAPIGAALRACHWSVHDTSRLGDSFPDYVVGARGRTFLLECKTPSRKDGGVKASMIAAGQLEAFKVWQGDAWIFATSPEQAVDLVRDALSKY